MNKNLENFLVTAPFWGMVLVASLDIAISPKPTARVNTNNTEYTIFKDNNKTTIRSGTFGVRELTDIDNNGTVDTYQVTVGAPRRPPITVTYFGKDIPKTVQEEYQNVIKYLK